MLWIGLELGVVIYPLIDPLNIKIQDRKEKPEMAAPNKTTTGFWNHFSRFTFGKKKIEVDILK